MTTAIVTDLAVDSFEVAAYELPTATEQESDGTLTWSSTTIVVVEVHAGQHTGVGYTYCHESACGVVKDKLAGAVLGGDPIANGALWARMAEAARQLGHEAITAMAISAVDVALWDLKAKLLYLPLVDLLPSFRAAVPAYGSGGFTDYDSEQLRAQLRGWVDAGFRSVKIKVGRDKEADVERLRIAREAIGDDIELMVDGNGAYQPKEALLWAERFSEAGVTYFEEPVTSQDLEGLRLVREHAPAGMAIAAGEYGWDLPSLAQTAGAVDILQADVTRCGGITNLLRVDALCKARNKPFSAHCAPSILAHVGCAMETLVHTEYFHDHARIEGMLFEGAPDPRDGLLRPDPVRPGLGLELRRADAARYEVARGTVSR